MSKISLVDLSLRFMAADRTAAATAVYFLAAVWGMKKTHNCNFIIELINAPAIFHRRFQIKITSVVKFPSVIFIFDSVLIVE